MKNVYAVNWTPIVPGPQGGQAAAFVWFWTYREASEYLADSLLRLPAPFYNYRLTAVSVPNDHIDGQITRHIATLGLL